MCQQSLIYYLCRELGSNPPVYQEFGIDQTQFVGNEVEIGQLNLMSQQGGVTKADIETLVCHSEGVIENEANVVKLGKETITYRHRLPESIRMQAARIDQKLASIKVLDPAIGSGAFPVGMMTEIVKLRMVLSMFIDDNKTPYDYKRHCIQNSLYGVDIDCGAVEIAKLRLWLSLVVDEEDIKKIKPLPNLDYKVVCGNSLESVEARLEHSKAFMELETLKKRYFDETIPGQKGKEKARIEELIRSLTGNKARFDYKIFFSEAFDHKGGFDVVIANPPYVHSGSIKEFKQNLVREFPKFFYSSADLYTYFYKRGIEVLKPGGHLCFISSNKFMRAGYGKNTRDLLSQKNTSKVVVDFGELPVFEAAADPAIVLVEKSKPTDGDYCIAAIVKSAEDIGRVEETVKSSGFLVKMSSLSPNGWILDRQEVLLVMDKLRKNGTPLGKKDLFIGIKTALNDAFVINESVKDSLIAKDSKSAEIIEPWLRGRDLGKWRINWTGLYLINIPSSANKQWAWTRAKNEQEARIIFEYTYPAIYNYFLAWEPQLTNRDDQGRYWWELRSCAYYEKFKEPKIIYADIAKRMRATIDYDSYYTDMTLFITKPDPFLLGLLNSNLFDWMYRMYFQSLGEAFSGGRVRFKTQYMQNLPICSATPAQKDAVISRVEAILADPDSLNVPRLEAEVNQLIYQLYKLTPEEIALVESRHEKG